jgi:PKD domain
MSTTRDLIKGALRLINVVSTNEEPSADDTEIAREALNSLINSKSNDLLNIHTITKQVFSLNPSQQEYLVGPALDDAGNATGANWVTQRPMRIEKLVLMLYSDFLDFTADPTEGIFPLTTTFTVNSEVPGDYLWTFGDGNTSTAISPTHTYDNIGSYDVTLSINGVVEVSKSGYITVRTPDVLVTATPTSGFIPLTVDFTATLI